MEEKNTYNVDLDFSEIAQTVDSVRKEDKKKFENVTLNKVSLWDNFFGFLVPIWGIFVVFLNMQKYPKRAKSLLIWVSISVILQSIFIYFCYNSFFEQLNKLCIMLFG